MLDYLDKQTRLTGNQCKIITAAGLSSGESIEMTGPTVATRVVADLRVHEAGNHRHEAIDVVR